MNDVYLFFKDINLCLFDNFLCNINEVLVRLLLIFFVMFVYIKED